jgi:hypothetical protein
MGNWTRDYADQSFSKANILRKISCQRATKTELCKILSNLSVFCLFLIRNSIIENEITVVEIYKIRNFTVFSYLKIG